MRLDVAILLSNHGVSLELRNYKGITTDKGKHAQANIFVNGNKALFFDDFCNNKGCPWRVVNEDHAKPLFDAKALLIKLPENEEKETVGFYRFEQLFYELIEDLLVLRDMRKQARRWSLLKWEKEVYEKGMYGYIGEPCNRTTLGLMIRKMENNGDTSVQLWNINEAWTNYTIEELRAIKQSYRLH